MAGIFISYRRDDSAADAGRLFDDLVRRCRDHVFIDLDTPLSADFRDVIREKLDRCDVVLALIGPRWLEVRTPDGAMRRLDDPTDYVRMEIEVALAKNKALVPLILPGARIPRPEDLPEDIRELAFRNGFDLRRDRWAVDLNELFKRLPATLGCRPEPRPRDWAYGLLLPIVLLSAVHVFTVFRLEALDPQIPSVVAALTLGAASTLQFRIRFGPKLLLSFLIAFSSVLADCVLVPFLEGERILPRGDEVAVTLRMIASFVAGRLAGYLVGSLLADALRSRGGGGPGPA